VIPLPGWVTGSLFIGIASGVAGMALGAFITHKLDQIPYSRLEASKATIQSAYDGYRRGVAENTARANAKALADQQRLQDQIDAMQGMLAAAQEAERLKSAELRRILANAKPGDIRALGPSAMAYFDRLRLQGGTTPVTP